MTSGSGNGWPDVIKVPAQKVVHDPLCKQRFDPYQPPCPECEILATARADEREQTDRAHRRTAQWAREKALADLRAKVEDLSAVLFTGSTVLWLDRDDVLALIDGSSDEHV